MSKQIIGVIPARGGSKGIPRKNIKLLGGKPLLAYSIEAALACPLISDVVVSTDDPEIQQIAVSYKAQAPFLRPPELASDMALAIPTIQHAVAMMESLRSGEQSFRYDYVVMLQPTTPFRSAQDLSEALGKLVNSDADGLISVIPVGNWHPIKMKRIDAGYLNDYQYWPVENPPRQSLPPVYMVNGAMYATKRDVLMEQSTFRGAKCLPYVMPEERSVNIDTEIDFLIAEYYLGRNQKAEKPNG